MKIIVKWTIKNPTPITSISVDQVHNKLIVGLGKQIVYYDAINGKELSRFERHTQDVTCVAFRKDGLNFASGAKDNIVYFWDITKPKPINKITFPDPLIRMGFNPCLMILLAMSKTTYAVAKEKAANKYPLNNTGVDFCWTNDGLKYAICFENGAVVIRDKDSDKDEKNIVVNEDKNEKITCCCFSTQRFLYKEYALYVCTWDKNFYVLDLFNTQVHQTQKLTADPISISLYKEDYVIVGTNNREINLFSKEGYFVTTITQGINSWVTSLKNFDKYSSIISASNDGSLICHQATFNVVHAIYREIYVYRKNLREIVVHNLLNGEKQIIETKRYIKKLAVFKNMVAYLSNDKIIVHQINDIDNTKGKYFIQWEGELSLILLTSNHLVVCNENHIYLYPLTNDTALITNVERDWSFETDVRYLRVLGGAPKREGMLCGTKSGEVYIIYLDNQFPINIYTHDIPIRSLDLNYSRTQLGIIDENYELTMVDLNDKSIMYKGEKAKSLAFNSDIENMVSYWYEGNVYIKTSDFPPIQEKMSGVIIGFRGTKVFILQSYNNVNVLDISNSQSIMRYVERKQMDEAYKVACLGATNQEWTFLGVESMLNFNFVVAANCFKKLQDIRFINLILKFEQDRKSGVDDNIIKGDIYAHIGKYKKASELYIKGGKPEKAQEMYSTLKMYTEAMEIRAKYMQSGGGGFTDEILQEQADWLENNKKYKEAGNLYMAIGKKRKAIEIYGEHNYLENLIEICRDLSKDTDAEMIRLCGHYFKKNHNYQYAQEAYLKLDDKKALVYMFVDLKKWDEAFTLSREVKQLNEYVHLKYAESLIVEDKFKEAQESYRQAGRIDLSIKLLSKLIDNSVYEKRFKDACFFFISYSGDALSLIKDCQQNVEKLSKTDYSKVKEFKDSNDLADCFNAYDYIYKYIEEPFNSDIISMSEQSLFNACIFLVNKITSMNSFLSQAKDISPSYIFYCLGILAKKFEANKTAQFCFNKLANLQFSPSWAEKIDKEILNIRTKSCLDGEQLTPTCPYCGRNNPLINTNGDYCTSCNAPFIRCSLSFEILPLVEFKPRKDITSDAAIDAIKLGTVEKMKSNIISTDRMGVKSLRINNAEDNDNSLFDKKLNDLINSKKNDSYKMLELDEPTLKSLNESDIFIIDQRNLNKTYQVRFFKNRQKELAITMCKFCFRFFKLEEFENAFLKCGNHCPLCKNVDEYMTKDIYKILEDDN